VLGLLLLVLLLAVGRRWQCAHRKLPATVLLAHLSLLFVPVGVGVVAHLGLIGQYGPRMLLALVLSTWAGLLVSALVLRALWPAEPAEPVKPAAP
jgi:holin-like protein